MYNIARGQSGSRVNLKFTRKVRALQGRMLGNSQRDECKSLSQRKCSRKYTAGFTGKGEMVR